MRVRSSYGPLCMLLFSNVRGSINDALFGMSMGFAVQRLADGETLLQKVILQKMENLEPCIVKKDMYVDMV